MKQQLHSPYWPQALVRHALGPGLQVSSRTEHILRSLTHDLPTRR